MQIKGSYRWDWSETAWYSLAFVASVCFLKQGNFRESVSQFRKRVNTELVGKKKKKRCKRLVILCLSAMGRGAGGRDRGGKKDNIIVFLLAKAARGKGNIWAKSAIGVSRVELLRDVGRTQIGVQKSREKTDGGHRALKTLETQAAFLVCSRSLFSFMQKHRCRFYQDFGLEHPQLWITDASCHV